MSMESQPTDLDLLAQSYVLGELDESEIERFEARLADDQKAREAVARAALWIEAVAPAGAAGPELPATGVAATSTATVIAFPTRAIVAIAAVVVVATTLVFVLARGDDTAEHVDDDKLIASWIAFGDSMDHDDADVLDDDDFDLETDADTPSWMISAMEERNR